MDKEKIFTSIITQLTTHTDPPYKMRKLREENAMYIRNLIVLALNINPSAVTQNADLINPGQSIILDKVVDAFLTNNDPGLDDIKELAKSFSEALQDN